MSQRFKDTRVSVDTIRLTQREETMSRKSCIHVCAISREKIYRDTIHPVREDLWRTTRFRAGRMRI